MSLEVVVEYTLRFSFYSLLSSGSEDPDPSDRYANSRELREVFFCNNTAKLFSSESDPYPIPNFWNPGLNNFPSFLIQPQNYSF